jgi:Uma2 family endonuclease
MSTPATNPPAPPKPRRPKPGRRVLIPCVEWDMYEGLLKVFERKRNLRLAYDNGDLEIMVPSFEHDGDAAVLGTLLATLAEELGLPLCLGGSTTLKRKRMLKGIEPDRCFWVTNAPKLAGVRKLDLKVHPPPDLAIEVDVTRSSLDRFRIYAALGVGELWRLDGDDLRFHVRAGKKYTEVPTSPTFAGITPADLMTFVRQARGAGDQTVTTKAFRAWVRQRVAAAASPPPPLATP